MINWIHISEKLPPQPGGLYLYQDVDGGYGVGVYEAGPYMFNPDAGECEIVWWSEFKKVPSVACQTRQDIDNE